MLCSRCLMANIQLNFMSSSRKNSSKGNLRQTPRHRGNSTLQLHHVAKPGSGRRFCTLSTQLKTLGLGLALRLLCCLQLGAGPWSFAFTTAAQDIESGGNGRGPTLDRADHAGGTFRTLEFEADLDAARLTGNTRDLTKARAKMGQIQRS